MNKKLTNLTFCLLLAVGWTISASAQHLSAKSRAARTMELNREKPAGSAVNATHEELMPQCSYAPLRSNYSITADQVRTKAYFDGLDPLTWTGANGTQTTLLSEPYTDPWGMIALLKRIYTDPDVPGIKYSASRQSDLPYFAVDFGWNIPGNGGEAVIQTEDPTCLIAAIIIEDLAGNELFEWWFEDEDYALPTGWTTSSELKHTEHLDFGGVYMEGPIVNNAQTGGTITIPLSSYNNPTSAYRIKIWGSSNATSGYYHYVDLVGGISGFNHTSMSRNEWRQYVYYLPAMITTPPTDNGYTILLVKLKDGVNEDISDRAPQFTYSEQDLYDYFSTYVSEIQLISDGLRVGEEGADNVGTMFAYTGMLNKFFFIGKGKMHYSYSTDFEPNSTFMHPDWAPFYSMYEEFSPTGQTDDEGIDDFYTRMMLLEYYTIEHDCESVIFKQHYFSMSGKTGHTENNVNCMVFYIPDHRGKASTGRDYDTDHQPRVGLYVIPLDAEVEPTEDPEWYNVTVTWESNLEDFGGGTTIPQIYDLYEIRDIDDDGDMDTTHVYSGPETSWDHLYPIGNPDSYPIEYYVIGHPTNCTNPETFFAVSNFDDVVIPGQKDFMGLVLKRYESDYVVSEEKNYYRNYIAPRNLEAIQDKSITPNTIGLGVRTLELWRGDKCVAYLDIKMDGDKCYYRIRYDLRYQDIEPGYGIRLTNPSNNE